MSNQLNDAVFEHIINCSPNENQIYIRSITDDTEMIEDTGSSIICKKCKAVILNYE